MSRCFNCEKNCETKRCTGCHQAFYCSKTCQKNHWSKHKENCIRADSSIHELFKVCARDVFPDPGSTVARDYGFDNVRVNHGDVLWGDFRPMMAETILLGVFQLITKDVGILNWVIQCTYSIRSAYQRRWSSKRVKKMNWMTLSTATFETCSVDTVKEAHSTFLRGYGTVWWLAPLKLRVSRSSRFRKWDNRSITSTMEA